MCRKCLLGPQGKCLLGTVSWHVLQTIECSPSCQQTITSIVVMLVIINAPVSIKVTLIGIAAVASGGKLI